VTRSVTGRVPTAVLALLVPIAAVAVAFVTLAASDPPGGSAAASAGGHSVVIQNFVYTPGRIVVTAGTPITVTNADGTKHTLTADNGSFDTGDLAGGGHGSVTIAAPGKYAYHCAIHNYMTGTIEVQP
jgi:plastocyanin